MKFSDLQLKPEIHRALQEMGYEEMTPIQEKSIPPILDNLDLVGIAETGSGKTGACGIPLVERVDPTLSEVQALILVPTRELAQQYVAEIASIAKYTDVAPFAMFGGFDMSIQRAKMKDSVHILVATPGRLIDYLWNNSLPMSHIRTMVLDEADEMLKMGFVENVDFLLSCLIHEHQTLLFSATMPTVLRRLAESYLIDPVKIQLNKDQVAPQSLDHHFQYVDHSGRTKALRSYLEEEPIEQAIVFCNSRAGGSRLHRDLQKDFDSVEVIHGGLEQSHRTSIFNRFKEKRIRLLVATDVAGRGLDFSHVSHVINYDFPNSDEAYTHRVGRTGRMGRAGVAMTFVADRELKGLHKLLGTNRFEPLWRGNPAPVEASGNGAGRGRRGPGSRGSRKRPSQRGGRRS